MDVVADRFGVYLVTLDPTVGSEISKTRPCVVVSPDDMNHSIRTTIIAPMTSTRKNYPTRVGCTFGGKHGEIVLDQIRTVDQARLVKQLGSISAKAAGDVVRVLVEMFE